MAINETYKGEKIKKNKTWKNIFEYLPIESLIYENQNEYYKAVEKSTEIGSSTPFIKFMLKIILDALNTPQVIPQDEK